MKRYSQKWRTVIKKVSLDCLIDLAIRLDSLLWKHPMLCTQATLPGLSTATEPMQLSCTQLSTSKRQRMHTDQFCFYCGQPDHIICLCPVRHRQPDMPLRGAGCWIPRPRVVSQNSLVISCCFTIQFLVRHSESVFSLSMLIDCGAAGNFINWDTAGKLQLPVRQLQQPTRVNAIDGRQVGSGLVTHCTTASDRASTIEA